MVNIKGYTYEIRYSPDSLSVNAICKYYMQNYLSIAAALSSTADAIASTISIDGP